MNEILEALNYTSTNLDSLDFTDGDITTFQKLEEVAKEYLALAVAAQVILKYKV